MSLLKFCYSYVWIWNKYFLSLFYLCYLSSSSPSSNSIESDTQLPKINKWRCDVFFIIEPCVKFFERLAKEDGFEFRVYTPVTPKKPTFVITWRGTHPELPAIMLNSHTDVVPVFEVSLMNIRMDLCTLAKIISFDKLTLTNIFSLDPCKNHLTQPIEIELLISNFYFKDNFESITVLSSKQNKNQIKKTKLYNKNTHHPRSHLTSPPDQSLAPPFNQHNHWRQAYLLFSFI